MGLVYAKHCEFRPVKGLDTSFGGPLAWLVSIISFIFVSLMF